MVKHLTRYLQILLIGTLCITLISCAGKRRGAGEPSAVPGATEPAPSAVTEEQIGGPVSLDPDRLKAFEALKAAALQEGALENVYFEYDSFTLTAESEQKLQRTASWLDKHPSVTVLVAGHCDERGMQEYNLALGERRAVAVQSYLSTLGVRPTTTEAISYGEERPAVPGSSEEAWAKNRRVEFTITNQ
ncbi:MAG TPA: peptidoglycan-associated lipoprotein Pal [Thermodesulfobacteriota bacterium]|nr:peptidoglycan-associated lipoprotein Pal [Deltaproteobacteria bacterium]HNR13589.1 peptidoglycan-associated lipoprotein Pal [Thermodesulfobacteriota bacterium]HOC38821.1 peptidoglycan-associated lipoprotein Pal [Thermodesulfobacteriota bacterium]